MHNVKTRFMHSSAGDLALMEDLAMVVYKADFHAMTGKLGDGEQVVVKIWNEEYLLKDRLDPFVPVPHASVDPPYSDGGDEATIAKGNINRGQ
jgi:hypothetical protein